MDPILPYYFRHTVRKRVTRVVAPTGSMRQQYVLSRLAANLGDNRQTLLVNLNPLRDAYLSAVRAMGGRIFGPAGRPITDQSGNALLHYLTVAGEGSGLCTHPREALEKLTELTRGRMALGKLMVLDGCQAVGPRDRPMLRTLTELALQRNCEVVAIGSSNDDTACLAEMAETPVKLTSKYELDTSRVNADWLLASLSWSPRPAE